MAQIDDEDVIELRIEISQLKKSIEELTEQIKYLSAVIGRSLDE